MFLSTISTKDLKIQDGYTPVENMTESSPITAVGWNFKVPHIFASAAENGTTTVWDLKNKKSIMSLSDPNQNLAAFNTELVTYFASI